jgi:N-acylethanolamine-hydrolysing acid amidase
MVITRNRDSIHDILTMDDALSNNKIYIVQTNYDRDVPDPIGDYRRVPAEQKLDRLGYNIT